MGYLLGYHISRGDIWINGAVNEQGTRTTALEIETYIETVINDDRNYLDIDGNGTLQAYLDGFLIIRYLLEYPQEGDGWIENAYDPEGTRTTAAEIEQYIEFLKP